MSQCKGDTSAVNEDMLRHMVLNSIRAYNLKFAEKYGDMVICCDNRSWRKTVWPNYKAKRKTNKDKSAHDWDAIYELMNKIRDKIKVVFPYKVLLVDGCEADDIIAVICQNRHHEPNVIVSGDHDFIQLHVYPGVEQYSPVQKMWVKCPSTMSMVYYLHGQIVKGCAGDGIPNIRSDDDVFIRETGRQKSITKKFLSTVDEALEGEVPDPELTKNYDRNERLMDFNFIPNDYKQAILAAFSVPAVGDKKYILTYLIETKCNLLIENIQDF